MLYRLLADAVLLLHGLFVAWVVLGGLLVWRRPRWALLHAPSVAWGAWAMLSGAVCPLTPLENRLRALGGEAGYGGSFIDHYLLPLLYPAWAQQASGRDVQVALGLALLALWLACYALAWRRHARLRRRARPGRAPP
jgi:hypothetical protein